jgi:multimeric flavodoxin WrbA
MTQPGTQRLLGLSAGAPDGSAEILLKQALQAAQSQGGDQLQAHLIRLDELHLPSGPEPSRPDDAGWLWEQLLVADGLIVSAPIYSRTIPARLKLLVDRLLGPNADRAIVERLLQMRSRGEEPAMAFRADERVLRPRVAGFIAVGGAQTAQWQTLALPALHLLTFSMQIAVVDQFVVSGAGTPQSIVLDHDALARAARLGGHVATQLGRPFEDAVYAGDPGLCPICHLDVVELRGRAVACATCGAQGRLADDFTVEWTDLTTSVISVDEKRQHYEEILQTAQQHAKVRTEITERASHYREYDPILRPDGR